MDGTRAPRVLGALIIIVFLAAVAAFALLSDAGRGGGVAPDASKSTAGEKARPPADASPAPADPHLAEELGAIATQGRGEDLHEATADPANAQAIDAAAREFLGHYLAYEVGELTRGASAGLRATSTPSFAAELLRAAPRFPPGLEGRPAPARVVAVDVVDQVDAKAESAGVVVRLARRGKPEGAAFTLEQRDGRWLVSGVTG